MTYREAIDFLFGLRFFGTKLGLENTFRLAELCGNPQDKLRFIHVAGTNGKGSTCAMLESIYRQAGLRTGFFTSPHLVSFTERIQVCRVPMSENDVTDWTAMLVDRISKANGGVPMEEWTFRPTFFEFVCVMGLLHFARAKCDLVIWETGMGGRLDATNIVTPLASVITNIQYDHERWLGSTLAEIAREKAGIIKPDVPVIIGPLAPDALMVVQNRAAELNAALHQASDWKDIELLREADLPLPSLPGKHQKTNAASAIKTVEVLRDLLPVTEEQLKAGLRDVRWAGRLQSIQRGNTTVLLDGAHNPDGAATLAAALRHEFRGHSPSLVLGLFRDKAWQKMCDVLAPCVRRIFLVPVESERTLDPAEAAAYCASKGFDVEIRSYSSLAEGLTAALRDSFVVVAGSLHLVGQAMEHFGVDPGHPNERSLNEWDADRRQI